ncbi:hypothetical protein BKA93DRAFT_596666 [Sparassis latifolia]
MDIPVNVYEVSERLSLESWPRRERRWLSRSFCFTLLTFVCILSYLMVIEQCDVSDSHLVAPVIFLQAQQAGALLPRSSGISQVASSANHTLVLDEREESVEMELGRSGWNEHGTLRVGSTVHKVSMNTAMVIQQNEDRVFRICSHPHQPSYKLTYCTGCV